MCVATLEIVVHLGSTHCRCSDTFYRSSLGVAGIDVHSHGERILKLGFSLQKASDVVAFNVAEDNTDILQYNQEIVALSNDMIPPLAACRLVAVGGNHTNTFLRAIKARSPTPLAYLQGPDGRLSADLLTTERPQLKQALEEGLNWFVIDYMLLSLFSMHAKQ